MNDPIAADLQRVLPGLIAAPDFPYEVTAVDVVGRPPYNPPEQVQRKFVGASYQAAYEEAARFVTRADLWSRTHGRGEPGPVIDFGSGWGRISRLLLAGMRSKDLYCLDVDQAMTATVNVSLPGVNALTVDPYPPTVLGDRSIARVLAFSVFSHLAEPAAAQWAQEFGRLLVPGGLAHITVLDHVFLDQVAGCQEAVRAGTADSFATSLAQMFGDPQALRQAYQAGELVYGDPGDDGARQGDFYGWAAAPRAWIERVWGDAGFDLLEWVPSGELFSQAMVCLRRR